MAQDLPDNIFLTQLDAAASWARKNSLWPMPFATACCGIELMATASSRFDLARFGAEVMRFSPRQCDLMIVAGRVVMKMLPVLQRIWLQMPEPKWCISMGACACTGTGEMAIRCGTARSVVLYMKAGMSVDDAVREAADDMRAMKGGLLSRITVHAIDAKGNHKVVAVNGDGSQTYWHWQSGMDAPEKRPAEPIAIQAGAPQGSPALSIPSPRRRARN